MQRPRPLAGWLPRALFPAALTPFLLLTSGATPVMAAVDSPAQWCRSARNQVLEWSATHAADRGRPYVTAIRRSHATLDRVIDPPLSGIVLRCRGRGVLSNGVTTPVKYGFRSVDGSWYLFLKRAR